MSYKKKPAEISQDGPFLKALFFLRSAHGLKFQPCSPSLVTDGFEVQAPNPPYPVRVLAAILNDASKISLGGRGMIGGW